LNFLAAANGTGSSTATSTSSLPSTAQKKGKKTVLYHYG
jgi:hypothetical protein